MSSDPATRTMWLVHNDQPQLGLVEHGFVSIGWPMFGDLRQVGDNREAMKREVAVRIPNIKTGAIPTTAGMLLAFAFHMKVGDLVLYPHKPDGTVNLGRISGPYEFRADVDLHPHRHAVEWLATDVSRSVLSQTARNEIGGALTVFRIKRNVDEVEALTDPSLLKVVQERSELNAAEQAVQEPGTPEADPFDAEQIEQATRDFIIARLHSNLEGVEFEHFVGHLLEAMGYRAKVTTASGDGGVDIIASRDPLGLEPPIIKVQCKRTVISMGGPAVQQLTGTLGPGGTELGLFVTLGAFSRDALAIARVRHDLRLISGNELVDLIFEHYEKFDVRYKSLLPLRSVYVVEREGLV